MMQTYSALEAVVHRVRRKSLLVVLICTLLLQVQAQDVKGGGSISSSSKGGGSSSSKFRENILAVQRVQQQAVPIQVVTQQQVSEIQRQQQEVRTSSQKSEQTSERSSVEVEQQRADSEPSIYGSVSGLPGVDFPAYTSIPNTKFSCDGVPFNPGMYADESTGCQVYHLCYQGRRESFICGIGTVFNQAIMNCDFWHSVECSKSAQYYSLNSELGKASAEQGASANLQQRREFASKSVGQQTQVFRPQVAQRTEWLVSKVQQQVVAPPLQHNLVRLEDESSFSSSSGKVSPRKGGSSRQLGSSLRETISSIKGGSSKSSSRKFDYGFNSQRTLLSPATKVIAYNEQRAQFASESSPVKTIAGESSEHQLKIGSNLMVEGSNKAQSLQVDESGEFGSRSAADSVSKSLNLIDTQTEQSQSQQASGDSEVWKPVFRSKISGKTHGKTGGKVGMKTGSSRVESVNEETTIQLAPANELKPGSGAPTVEPTFSSNSSPAQPVESPASSATANTASESASVQKGAAPPASQPPTTTASPSTSETEPASESASVESDVGATLGSTTAAELSPTSSTTESAPQTSATQTPPPPPPTTTTPSPNESPETASATTTTTTTSTTTTPAPTTTTTTTTTTSTTAQPTTSKSEPSEDSTAASSDEPGEPDQVARKRRKKKKRRGTGQAASGIPPAPMEVTQTRATASSVEYAGNL